MQKFVTPFAHGLIAYEVIGLHCFLNLSEVLTGAASYDGILGSVLNVRLKSADQPGQLSGYIQGSTSGHKVESFAMDL